MSERQASGDFDYPREDIPDTARPDDYDWDDGCPDVEPPGPELQFDAFDANTWYFEPAPPPWYRAKQTLTLFVAATVAAVALVVSGVLLVFGGPDSTVVDEITSVTRTEATTAATRPPSRTSARPSPPPPPPAETSAAPPAPVPVQTYRPRAPSTRTTKEPEFGVTRTPATRAPISVAPQRPSGSQR